MAETFKQEVDSLSVDPSREALYAYLIYAYMVAIIWCSNKTPKGIDQQWAFLLLLTRRWFNFCFFFGTPFINSKVHVTPSPPPAHEQPSWR